ncbi:MAG: diguanylate cyclase [Chloroflexi bacterium RBG_19FT_COMBO_49_13]|nr:MAG: diguanylate cyclase [Chloroflexi bacterium RBG_16_47_49]OGO61101.1 MAG: diguanylate cyclase [Chloroflexi bacterium RBG_19FT_COMBO_49_13]
MFIVSIVLFTLVNLAPGGPLAGRGQSRRMRPEQIAILKRQFGLDQPLYKRYIFWLVGNDWTKVDTDGDGIKDSPGQGKGILRGDFGMSYRTRQPVIEAIRNSFKNTAYLMSVTLIVVAIIAIPVGVISAVKQYSIFDIIVTTLSFMGQAIPEFWLGLILILVFYVWLKNPMTGDSLLPAGGMYTLGMEFSLLDWIKHLILPVTMGVVGWVTWYSRFLRSSMLDVIHQDYVRTARAKGLRMSKVYFKHALRNALLPLVTIFALDLPYIFAGSLYVEIMFSWPGMGRLYYQAAIDRDYPLLMAILTIGTVVVVLSNLLADVIYAKLDPRIHYD